MKAYETYHKTMGEIIFYTVNSNTIKMDDLLQDKKTKKRIVLSTSEGKYVVPKQVKRWSPIGEYFKNHLTGVIRTIRITHQGKCIGGNINFIVDIIGQDGQTETIQLMQSDYRLKIFKNFNLTKECLLSKDSLQAFLERKRDDGLLSSGSTIKVYNVEENTNTIKEHFKGRHIIAERWSAPYYYIFGPLYTWYSGHKIKKVNKRNQRKHIKQKN
jgi:hypothetical protein